MRKTNYYLQKYLISYLFISPFFILFIVFGLYPIIQSFLLSFRQVVTIDKSIFVGLDNYIRLMTDILMIKAVINTLIIWVVAHIVLIPGAFIMAFLLDRVMMKGLGFYETVIFTPAVTSTIAVAFVFMTIFGKHYGLVNNFLRFIGLGVVDWKGSGGIYLKPMIITLFVWKWFGYNAIIFLAGLQGIDPELYDFAFVEGASKRQVLWYITFPLMKPILFFILFTSIIAGLQIYEEPMFLTRTTQTEFPGGVNHMGLCIAPYMMFKAFTHWHFGYASAMAYLVVIFIIVSSAISRRFFETDY